MPKFDFLPHFGYMPKIISTIVDAHLRLNGFVGYMPKIISTIVDKGLRHQMFTEGICQK